MILEANSGKNFCMSSVYDVLEEKCLFLRKCTIVPKERYRQSGTADTVFINKLPVRVYSLNAGSIPYTSRMDL